MNALKTGRSRQPAILLRAPPREKLRQYISFLKEGGDCSRFGARPLAKIILAN